MIVHEEFLELTAPSFGISMITTVRPCLSKDARRVGIRQPWRFSGRGHEVIPISLDSPARGRPADKMCMQPGIRNVRTLPSSRRHPRVPITGKSFWAPARPAPLGSCLAAIEFPADMVEVKLKRFPRHAKAVVKSVQAHLSF
jgi:hypothetical protein